MKSLLSTLLLASPALGGSFPTTDPTDSPEYIFSNPPVSTSEYRIPTSYESAVMGRRILALTPLGTLSTIFPSSSYSSSGPSNNNDNGDVSITENRPSDVGGMPVGLMDYIADCEDDDEGNPTILAIKIATSFKNARDGSNNISLSVHWTPPYPPDSRIESQATSWLKSVASYMPWVTPSSRTQKSAMGAGDVRTHYSAANLPRFSLLGHFEPIPDAASNSDIAKCFVHTHPDAKYWLPGNRIHSSEFVRLVVTHVYWVGGFGDRAYIGWIPVEEWNNVTREEWQDTRLPGEKKGWKEWLVDVASLEL
ncbi:hypothetical protein MKZ38_007003 [Zalerion maritima]|uniref:CREG-like beta-barrel domain-containing protein n=1 Tax=Zalerion maritima TaxID=339359 RepID=A0AAD5RIE4_9PEZI|nr:hypothetical protein MKZ38_007003 [Zalerion maritima]